MTESERAEAVAKLKQICYEIGCSGLNPDMCQNKPQQCQIIRKLVGTNQNDKRKANRSPKLFALKDEK